MRVVIAPDSFKGSLPACVVANAIEKGLRRVWLDAECRLYPMADGGEGTLDAIAATRQGSICWYSTVNSEGRPIEAPIWFDGSGHALIEVAQIIGLPAVTDSALVHRTTVGVGLLLKHALEAGANRISIALGGTATNDGGVGMMQALGCRLMNQHEEVIPATLDGLQHLARVDWQGLDVRLTKLPLVALTDVNNPLCGERGATRIFGRQKGVPESSMAEFDARLAAWARLAEAGGIRQGLANSEGAGAAGGLGYALKLLGASQQAGAQTIAEWIGLPAVIAGADWVITGEGRSDRQTLAGKAPYEVAQLARRHGVPVTLLSGGVVAADLAALTPHFDGVFSLVCGPMTLEAAKRDAATLLANQAEQLARLFGRAR
ncbi:glycerate kinase [Chitinivorax sp. B]|uniref:glycerate kinase n=1 Tax=Chitinivorax sp. B TaxID=2502235 RepID=UPI0010F63B62|nr:glycerate kinase [Chitinivorax sp. B]